MSGNIEDIKLALLGIRRPRVLSVQLSPCSRDISVRKCKSLPNIDFNCSNDQVKPKDQLPKKGFGQRPKILRKTWDRVKGIINSPSTSGGTGGNRMEGKKNSASSSAPSTPLRHETFFGDGGGDERDRIARNYALLQKRLSQEFRQSNMKSKAAPFGGEYSDDFKRKLFEWESHPSKRKPKGDVPGKESHAMTGVGGLSSRHLKELTWLDKQLEKIEQEKKRLEEELRKQVERESRIQKMKEAIRCSANDSVYNIKTESGVKVRVEGITSEYAMKVYEWEEKQGIRVEMSALGYFDPKYRDEEDTEKVDPGKREEAEDDSKDEEVVGPLDLINERLKKLEQEEKGDSLGDRGAMLLAECVALGEVASGTGSAITSGDVDGRISSTASSCCCSAEYDYEHTDSFATKNNSGASNTDSDVYDKRCTITRRRSSDCLSTPDRASPALSAFTSEDEEVKEETDTKKENEEDKGRDIIKPLCVKQIVIDEEPCEGNSVFVPTKRTIFSPVVEGECGSSSASTASACCTSPRIVGAIPKRPGYKPQPKTQLNRVFPGNVPVYCSPMAARRAFSNEGRDGTEFSIDKFLQDRGISRFGGVGRKLPPRTNAHVPRKYTIGGGFAPSYGRGCLITRSSSFNGEKDGGVAIELESSEDLEVDRGGIGFSVSKSKSTGSIKKSIASVKSFLGFGKGGGGSNNGSCLEVNQEEGLGERRGSRSGGFVKRWLWRGKEEKREGD